MPEPDPCPQARQGRGPVGKEARPGPTGRAATVAVLGRPYTLPQMSVRGAPTTVEILERLVSFDTTSRSSNHALIDWVRGYLDGLEVSYTLSHHPTEAKSNLHAVVGPDLPGGFVLSGHVDTVPVEGQAWSSDPFSLTRRDGRLYGRGSTDMKGFVASMLAAVPAMQAAWQTGGLARPMHLFITYDEEVTCDGARVLVEQLRRDGQSPALCIVGEPTMMRPVTAHKGRLAAAVKFRGRAAHSSRPAGGLNAVHAAARAAAFVAAEAERLAREGRRADGFDPPHSTTQVGRFEGGSALNIIPAQARFEVEWRSVPGDSLHALAGRLRDHVETQILPAMRAADPASGYAFEVETELPPLALPAEHPLAALVHGLTGVNTSERVSYGTEAGIYQNAGIASLVCGPGDIAQAHQPDEYIETNQLDACDRFVGRLIERLASGELPH